VPTEVTALVLGLLGITQTYSVKTAKETSTPFSLKLVALPPPPSLMETAHTSDTKLQHLKLGEQEYENDLSKGGALSERSGLLPPQ
jgi:hypothetical protein